MKSCVTVTWVERGFYPCGSKIKPHQHAYIHLYYILTGEAIFANNEKTFSVSPGSFFLMPENTPHSMEKVTSAEPLTTIEIKFNVHDEFLQQDIQSFPICFKVGPMAETLLTEICEYYYCHSSYYENALQAYFYSLITYAAQSNHERPKRKVFTQFMDTFNFSNITLDIIDYIERNFSSPITLQTIAEYVGYNKNYICSVFKHDMDMTIIDYLNYVRIITASQYFKYSDRHISRVAQRCGFSDVSHFSHTFKKIMGVSPAEYRRRTPDT